MAAMGYAILRMEPRTIQGTAAMLRHALREAPVPTPSLGQSRPRCWQGMAQPRQAWPCCGHGRGLQSSQALAEVHQTRGGRARHVQPRRWHAPGQAPAGQLLQGCPDFLNARYGAENVLCAAIHRDETTSHLQVLIAARHEGGRLSSSKLMGNRTALSALQDDFHEAVAKPFGLLRGEKRTNAKHVPVRALYAAMNAGAEPPDFRPVPPELTMGERLRLNGYQKEEREKQRQQAIEHNNAQRELLTRQAADGRKLHPSLIAKQATRYRAAVQQAENAAQAATRAENGPQRPGKGPRQGKGRPRLWTSSWTPKGRA